MSAASDILMRSGLEYELFYLKLDRTFCCSQHKSDLMGYHFINLYMNVFLKYSQVLHDAHFDAQTPDTFQRVCDIKVKGIDYLDRLTRKMCATTLDYFVAFSSAAAGKRHTNKTVRCIPIRFGNTNVAFSCICDFV